MTFDLETVWPQPPDQLPPFVFQTPDEVLFELGERRRRQGPRPARARATDTTNTRTRKPPPEMLLYVSNGSLPSLRAETVLRSLVRQCDPGSVRLRVVDVARNIEAAERDRVIYTPTLICRSTTGDTRVLGDLSNVDVLLEVLRAMGVDPQ